LMHLLFRSITTRDLQKLNLLQKHGSAHMRIGARLARHMLAASISNIEVHLHATTYYNFGLHSSL